MDRMTITHTGAAGAAKAMPFGTTVRTPQVPPQQTFGPPNRSRLRACGAPEPDHLRLLLRLAIEGV